MANATILDDKPKQATLKNQFVPHSKRESENVDWQPFVYETVKFFVVAKLSAVAGYFIGREMAKRHMSIGKFRMDGYWGGIIGGVVGGVYELFSHWKKSEGKRLGVANISSDLMSALDPAQTASETTKEREILDGLKELQSHTKSHVNNVLARRDASPEELGRA